MAGLQGRAWLAPLHAAVHDLRNACMCSCILPALSLLWLGLTACIDPGIIPRQEPDQEYLMGNKPR